MEEERKKNAQSKITESQLQDELRKARQSADQYKSKLSTSDLKAYVDKLRGYSNADWHNSGRHVSPPPVGLDDIGFIKWYYEERGSWT